MTTKPEPIVNQPAAPKKRRSRGKAKEEESVAQEGPHPTEPWVDEAGATYLSQIDLLRLNEVHERGARISAQADAYETRAKLLKLEFEKNYANLTKQAAHLARLATKVKEVELLELTSELTKKYGVDFRDVTYSSESGRISHIDSI